LTRAKVAEVVPWLGAVGPPTDSRLTTAGLTVGEHVSGMTTRTLTSAARVGPQARARIKIDAGDRNMGCSIAAEDSMRAGPIGGKAVEIESQQPDFIRPTGQRQSLIARLSLSADRHA